MRGVPPPRRGFALRRNGVRGRPSHCAGTGTPIASHTVGITIDVLRERVDDRAVRVDVMRIADDADDVVALLPVAELLSQAVIAEHLAVIRRDDDHRVVPHAELAERVPDPAELIVDLADHPVVLRAHVAHPRLVGRCRRPWIVEHHVVHPVALRGGSDRQRHVGRVVRGGPLPGGRVRRMGSQVAEVREPRRLLATQPLDRVIGEERRHAVLGRAVGLGRQQVHRARRRVVAERGQPVDPWPVVVGDVEHGVEAGQDAVVRRQSWVVGTAGEPRIERLVGVAEQHRFVAGPPGGERDRVEPGVEWRAVGDDSMVHLVHARVEAGPTWPAGRRLAVVVRQPHPGTRERVEVRRAHERVSGGGQTVAAELVERDEQDVDRHRTSASAASTAATGEDRTRSGSATRAAAGAIVACASTTQSYDSSMAST